MLATVSDKRLQVSADGIVVDSYTADVVSAQDYYPFGMLQPGRSYNAGGYRYGFNGKENDNEVKGEGNSIDFGARIYDTRIGRWFSVDKVIKPSFSSYEFAKGNPVNYIDPDGNDEIHFYYYTQDHLSSLGKSFTTITISTQIVKNGNSNHTFFVHNQNIGSLDGSGVQIKPFVNGTNLPNQSSFAASENGLPLAPVTSYLYGLGKNYTDDYEYLGKLLQVDPTVLEYYKNDQQWNWAFNGAQAQASTAKIAKQLVGISEKVFAVIDGLYALKGLASPWLSLRSGVKSMGFSLGASQKSAVFINAYGKCAEFAKAYIQDFGKVIKSYGGKAEIFEINIGKNNIIGTSRQMLSDNGMHRYVEVTIGGETRIFDNFHPDGILKADYAKEIEGMINLRTNPSIISEEDLIKSAQKVK